MFEKMHKESDSSKRLTWVSANDDSSSTKIAAIWDRILLIVLIEGIRSMVSDRIWVVAASTRLNCRAISTTIATGIVQCNLQGSL